MQKARPVQAGSSTIASKFRTHPPTTIIIIATNAIWIIASIMTKVTPIVDNPGLMIPDEASSTQESKKKRHVSVPSRNYGAQHIETPDYVHENDGPHQQDQPDGLWSLAIEPNDKHIHRGRACHISSGTPEMHLDALFGDDPASISSTHFQKHSGHGMERRTEEPFHSPTLWAPSADDHTHRHSEEHHPPSIHSFSAPGSHLTHAVPAHRGGKLKQRYHEENDPTDHHNHHRHQCDDEDCSDHDDTHIHSHFGNSKELQQSHPGFVHYSTPHNRTVGSYDAKFATRLPRHAVQTYHSQMQAPNSPELNLGTLFREDILQDHAAGKSNKCKQSKIQVPTAALISDQHAHRIRHHHEPRISRSITATQTLPHGQSYAEGYVFEVPKSLKMNTKQHSPQSHPLRRRSIILSGFREVDPVSRYYPAGMYLAPTSVQHGLASAYLRHPSLTHHRRHYNTASHQQQPYPPIRHNASAGGEYATHIGIGGVKSRFSGPVETMHDLFEGLDTHPAHCQPVQGHASEHTPIYHSGVPHEAQSISVQHTPSNTGAMPQKKTWYGIGIPIEEGSRPGPWSLGFDFKEIRKVAMEGRPFHMQHASGPSTPVSSSVSAVRQHQASEFSKPKKTYSAAVAHPYGPANLTRRPCIKRQRKDARREMKSTLDRNPHQTLRHRLSVLETMRTAMSGVRTDLIEDMKLNELFAEPASWSAGHDRSSPSTVDAGVLASLGGIRHFPDAALSVPAMVAHSIHVDGQQDTEHSTVVHHSQNHSHDHSKAVTLKTLHSGRVDLSLYPEEEPNYPRDSNSQDPSMHENPAQPNNVAACIIEMPYHLPRTGTPMVSHVSGNMRLGQGHHLAHHQHYHIQNCSTTPRRLHTHSDHAMASHAPAPRSQLDHHRAQREYHNLSASFFRAASPISPKDRSPEENAGYPRTDNPSYLRTDTLERSQKIHSYNHSKAASLPRPASPLYLYSEEQSSYPRDSAHDVASAEYDPRADDAVHQSRAYAPNPYIHRNPVHEIQLDDEDQHSHHDAHPTLTESAAAAVSSGLDGFKAMLQSIHLPNMVVGALLPETREHLQAVQHHAHEHQHEHQDHRPVLKYKELDGERNHHQGDESIMNHSSHLAANHGSFVPSEHHRRHVEHVSTSSYAPVHTSSASSQSAAATALATKHASPVSVLPPESLSRAARLIRPPTGFGRSADEDLGEDETIVWTKTVNTTTEFYEIDDDNVNIDDELSIHNQHHGGQHQHQGYVQGRQQQARSQRPAL
ncbi:hypothetical protein BG000_001820 [Podila horticola]|nr:hypothetical protein BG000_001820 [Podila horticola]